MSNFFNALARLRDAAARYPVSRGHAGNGNTRTVERRDLAELLHHFDRLDAEGRMGYPPHIAQLADAGAAALQQLDVGDVRRNLAHALHLVRPSK